MTETTTVPAVYIGIAEVLAKLKVNKDGKLPGNMGSSAYFPASTVSATVKGFFVDAKLILLSNETQTHYEITTGDRAKIATQVRGEYTIVSTVDGSQAVISGTGDGLAINTAVSSNIASTNALKNALLRTFLISEQSVEDKGHTEQAAPPTPKALNTAVEKKAPTRKPAPAKKPIETPGAVDNGTKIRALIDHGYVPFEVASKEVNGRKDRGATTVQAQADYLATFENGDIEKALKGEFK